MTHIEMRDTSNISPQAARDGVFLRRCARAGLMSGTRIAFLCLAAFLIMPLLSRAADPAPTAAIIVRLDNVQELFGGQTLVLDADGNLFARKISKGKEQRYHLKLPPDELKTLLAFIASSGIRDYHEHERPGVPDEAQPMITLTLPNQEKLVAKKWADDKAPTFDKLYERLSQLVKSATKTPAYREQQYDYRSNFP